MWNRLLSVVEEQAQTLVRTAFSTSVREAGGRGFGPDARQERRGHRRVALEPAAVAVLAGLRRAPRR